MLLNVKIVGLGIGKNVIKDVIAHNLIAYNVSGITQVQRKQTQK